ncbi:sensor histidine kinase [Trujillonella endophytica]|uniref:Anti-sigma regulatory factor (Ser/Thr protein kinase) n=1 Tax=Trujillonella endophytica TaxID=673521 RepID=A0A1H8WD59_9ACTN|nr:sensor histidine kinase [Trujillella endophytica]SEP25580.1 Anti-sigma regulatory factor (Ser/Thr protein kinase) [Trujillella endophytica]
MNRTAADGGAHAPRSAHAWPAADAGHGHAALLYADPAGMLAATTPFLQAGLDAGDLTVLALRPEMAELVGGALGERVGAVESDVRLCLLGARAPDAFTAVRRAVERSAATGNGRLRVVGEPGLGRPDVDAREAVRFEAAVNSVLAGAPVWALCLYDRQLLDETQVAQVVATHPQLAVGDALLDNPRFREPASVIRSLPVPRDPLERTPPVLAVDGATVLAELRSRLRVALVAAVADRALHEDLLLAVSEVAANAFRHGSPPVSARLWGDGRRLVCTITDSGRGFDDPLAGFRPAHGEDLGRGGMGLWLARKLWDSVDLIDGGRGLTVRMSTTLG